MKLFVTVGTYKFDSLVKHLDETFKETGHEIIFQIGEGTYQPCNFEYFNFTNEFDKYTDWADIIVTHAGAGTVYSLLKQDKSLVVVPNLERVDSHQSEIAKYATENNFAFECQAVEHLTTDLSEMTYFFEKRRVKYTFQPFFKKEEITSYLLNSC